MITRLLGGGGLYLGPPDDLMPPCPDNPEGYYENTQLSTINDEILKHLGGAWDCPPPAPESWDADAALAPLKARARDVIALVGKREPWGWKDPRNCLTAPFWKSLVPDLRFVICVRNPLEVIHSQQKRQGFTSALTQSLWLRYYRDLLVAAPLERRVVTHYESYFANPTAELRRVLAGVGIGASEEAIERACATPSSALRHHRFTIRDLMTWDIDPAVVKCYLELCAEANFELVPSVFRAGDATSRLTPGRPCDLSRLEVYAGEMERRLDTLTDQLADKEREIHELGHRVRQFWEIGPRIHDQETIIRRLHAEIAAIGASRAWRLIHRVKRLRSIILPFRKAG
jgi:hypothetical protein